MRRRLAELKSLYVFRITEEPEELIDTGGNGSVLESIEYLKSEVARLGKSQIQARMFAKSEYQSLKEAIEALSSNNHIEEMVIEDLFSIADGLEAGIRAGEGKLNPEMNSWFEGLKIVHQRVMALLGKLDVQPLHSVGTPFDPSFHIAVAVEYEQEADDNIILEEQLRGYMHGQKVVRYAEVIVNKYPARNEEQVEEDNERQDCGY